MSFFVYIGDLDHFHTVPEGESSWSGNFPEQIGPSFVQTPGDVSMFFEVRDLAMSDDNEGKQTDWGCWVAIVTPDQILNLLDKWYGEGPIEIPEWMKKQKRGKNRKDDDIRLFVRSLDQNKRYGLVALED